jgi:hypothetical protein
MEKQEAICLTSRISISSKNLLQFNQTSMFKAYRLIFGIILLVAIFTQLLTFWQIPINFFSYFSILSNLFVALVFIFSSLSILNNKYIDSARGAATVYMTIVGFGFVFLLNADGEELIPWVNIVLHYVAPIVVVADWMSAPSMKISLKQSLFWIWFPLTYTAYTLIRGAITGWYPYEFFNPHQVGHLGVVAYFIILLIAYFTLSWITIRLRKVFF